MANVSRTVITWRMTLEPGKTGTWGGITNLSQLLNNLSSEGLSPADLCESSEHCGADVKVNHKLQNYHLLPFQYLSVRFPGLI